MLSEVPPKSLLNGPRPRTPTIIRWESNLAQANSRRLYREKLDAGLARRSVNYNHVTLHRALKSAVADGLIPRNSGKA